jgi:hypothetical protein
MHRSGQQFIRSLRALFGQDRGAENVVRFAYHVAQCFQVVLFVGHEQTVATRQSDCNRLLFSSNATLGHYHIPGSSCDANRSGYTMTDGLFGTIDRSSWSTLFASVRSAITKRAMCANVETVSSVVRFVGFSKSNNTGRRSRWRSSLRIASSTAFRSGVNRPSINTTFDVIVSMTCRIF